MRKLFVILLFTAMPFAHASNSVGLCGQDGEACLAYGAQVFQQRCSLCHGNDGLGEGIIPLSIKDYPNTNLMSPRYGTDHDSVRKVILHGSNLSDSDIAAEMPPWGDELTYSQVESVTRFVLFMRQDIDAAVKLLNKEAENVAPSLRLGRAVFTGRCALCHGTEGDGSGRMANILKNPPPFNLTLSILPDSPLREIITKGGAEVGRSEKMPPWGGDLTNSEIESVILYVKSLRKY